MRELTRGIVEADAQRGRFLSALPRTNRARLGEMRKARERAAAQQRARLARERAALVTADASRRRQAATGATERAESRRRLAEATRQELAKLHREHQEAGRRLRARLARERALLPKAEAARRREGAEYAKLLARTTANRRTDIQGFLRQLGHDRLEPRQEWQRMLATVARRRRGSRQAAASSKRHPAATATAPAPAQPEPQGADRAGSEGASIGERVFEVLAAHPEGMVLADLAGRLDKPQIAIAGTLNRLIGSGRVDKRDLHYLARAR